MRAIIQQSKTLYAREHKAPESLELLLFLYCDKDLWNYAAIIDEAIAVAWEAKKNAAAAAAAAAVATAAHVAEENNEDDDENL